MSEPTAPLGAAPRSVRATPLFDLPRRDADREFVQVAIDPLGDPVQWSAERIDSGNEGRGVYRIRVFHDGATEDLPIGNISARGPRLTPGPDGRWLVVSCRVTNAEEQNATLYSASGERLTSFHAGDGIRDAQISPSGEIW